MILLRRNKLEVPKKYIYLTSLLFSFAVILQISSTEQNPTNEIYARHIVLFTSIYVFWALCIDYINQFVQPFKKERSRATQFTERFISAFILVIVNLIITNIIYYGLLIGFINFSLSEAYYDFQPYIVQSIIIRFIDIVVIGLILKIIHAYQTVQKQIFFVVFDR